MKKICFRNATTVLAFVVLTGCRSDHPAPSREWRSEEFNSWVYPNPVAGTSTIVAKVSDGMLHVVDAGKQPGDLIVMQMNNGTGNLGSLSTEKDSAQPHNNFPPCV